MTECARGFLRSMPIYGVAGDVGLGPDDLDRQLMSGLSYYAAVDALAELPGDNHVTTDWAGVEAAHRAVVELIERQRRRRTVRELHTALGRSRRELAHR